MNGRLETLRYVPRPLDPGATVTIVITCFNYARYLPQAVESVLNQSGVDLDVVIVDDASTDSSLEVARALASADSRIQVLANERNLGAVGAFNRGLEHATGQFLVRLDADDLLTPGSLERSVALLQEFPNVGLVYGHPLHFADDTLPAARTIAAWWDIWAGRDWLAARCRDGTNAITSPEVVMRRSVVDDLGGMRPLAHTHDMELWLRISAFADIAHIGGADQAWHREHPASLSTNADHPLIILREIKGAFDELFAVLGPDYPGGLDLHGQARYAVANHAVAEALRLVDRGRFDPLVKELTDFAAECAPAIVDSPAWRRATGHRSRPLTMVTGVASRARRRGAGMIRQRRWHSSGVYEGLRVARGGSKSSAGGDAR